MGVDLSIGVAVLLVLFVFFFNDTATTEIYTLSLHDALPISWRMSGIGSPSRGCGRGCRARRRRDRKSTRLNSSHSQISYAVFCLKKKKNKDRQPSIQRDLLRLSVTPP